jgi:dCTP deaminase
VVLSHTEIKRLLDRKELVIRPEPEKIQPASVDIHLGSWIVDIKRLRVPFIDLSEFHSKKEGEQLYDRIRINPAQGFILHPGEFVAVESREYVKVPRNLIARIDGRSSLARLGLAVHATAGEVDPGFPGTVVFELTNHGKIPLKLYPGLKVGRLTFFKIEGEVKHGYGELPEHKFSGQRGIPTPELEKDVENREFMQEAKKKLIEIERNRERLKSILSSKSQL